VIRVGAPRDMPVYFPAFAVTKLYCLVTDAVVCEPKVVARQRRGRASNPRLLDRKSDALPTTKPPRHPMLKCFTVTAIGTDLQWHCDHAVTFFSYYYYYYYYY